MISSLHVSSPGWRIREKTAVSVIAFSPSKGAGSKFVPFSLGFAILNPSPDPHFTGGNVDQALITTVDVSRCPESRSGFLDPNPPTQEITSLCPRVKAQSNTNIHIRPAFCLKPSKNHNWLGPRRDHIHMCAILSLPKFQLQISRSYRSTSFPPLLYIRSLMLCLATYI